MIGTIVIAFVAMAIGMFFIFLCVSIAGCMGLLGLVSPFILKRLSVFHDKPFIEGDNPINNECFICLQRISDEVVATCNHSYCGECITRYIESNAHSSISCPACRKEVLVLFRRFQPLTSDQVQIKNKISEYNYKYTRKPGFFRAILEFGNTIRHIPLLFTENGIRYVLNDARFKYIILFAIYALSPFDILPEAILGPFGLFDDGIAIAGLVRQISVLLYGFIRQESNRQ